MALCNYLLKIVKHK